jgi:hypothetical protein
MVILPVKEEQDRTSFRLDTGPCNHWHCKQLDAAIRCGKGPKWTNSPEEKRKQRNLILRERTWMHLYASLFAIETQRRLGAIRPLGVYLLDHPDDNGMLLSRELFDAFGDENICVYTPNLDLRVVPE